MIVADTNLLVYLLLPGAFTDEAESVLEKDAEWWRSEFRNVLAGYVRKRLLTRPAAVDTFRRAKAMVDGHEYDVDTATVMALVEASSCCAYDCEFVALAEELGIPLVTSDTRILSHFPWRAMQPAAFIQ